MRPLLNVQLFCMMHGKQFSTKGLNEYFSNASPVVQSLRVDNQYLHLRRISPVEIIDHIAHRFITISLYYRDYNPHLT